MMELTISEKYVLAQLLVSGDLSEGEFRGMNEMTGTTKEKACQSLSEMELIGKHGVRRNPYNND